MADLVEVVYPNGARAEVPETSLAQALAEGAKIGTGTPGGAAQDDGGLAGGLAAGILGAGSSATLGQTDRLLREGSYVLGGRDFERDVTTNLRNVRERNPGATMAGEFGGLILAPEALGGVGDAAGGLVAGEGLAAAMARSSARFAAESALIGAQQKTTEDALGDHQYNAEAIFAQAAKDALIGGAVGAPLGALGYGGSKALGLLRGKPGPIAGSVLDELVGVEGAGKGVLDQAASGERAIAELRASGATSEQAVQAVSEMQAMGKAAPKAGLGRGLLDDVAGRFSSDGVGLEAYEAAARGAESAEERRIRDALELRTRVTEVLRNAEDPANNIQFTQRPDRFAKLVDATKGDVQADAIAKLLQETDKTLASWESMHSQGGEAAGSVRSLRKLWLDLKEALPGAKRFTGYDVPLIGEELAAAGADARSAAESPFTFGAEERPVYMRPDGKARVTFEDGIALKSPPAPAADSIEAFADAVKRVGNDTTDRFGRHKVFIADLSDRVRAEFPGMTEAEFRSRLIDAHRDGYLQLARADLVPAMSKARVAASEVPHMNATFHFLDLEGTGAARAAAKPRGSIALDLDAGLRGELGAKDAFRLSSAKDAPRKVGLAAEALEAGELAASRRKPIKITSTFAPDGAELNTKANAFKQALDRHSAWGRGGGGVIDGERFRVGIPGATQDITRLADNWRAMLEDASIWGKAGDIQASSNRTFSELLPRRQHLMGELAADIDVSQGMRIPEGDFAKAKSFLEKITGNPEVDEALQPVISARRWIDGTRARLEAIREGGISEAEEAQFTAGKAAIDAFEKTLNNAMKEAAAQNRIASAAAAEHGSGIGGVVGLVADMFMRPVTTMQRLGRLAQTVEKVEEGIRSGLRKIGRGEAGAPAAQRAPRPRAKIIEDIENVRVLASNPAALETAAARMVGDLSNYAPKVANELRLTAMRTLLYLAREAPPASTTETGAFGKPTPRYSDIQLHDWDRKRGAALDARTLADDVKAGRLNRDAIEAAKFSSPKLFARLQELADEELIRMKKDGTLDRMSYQDKAAFATLLERAPDQTWTGEFMATIQASKAAPPPPSGDASKPADGSRLPTKSNQKPLAESFMTASQGIESGGQVR